MQANTIVLPEMCYANFRAPSIAGYRKTREDDITSTGGKLSNSLIITAGSKMTYPREVLNVFTNIKNELIRQLDEFSVNDIDAPKTSAVFSMEFLERAEALYEEAEAKYIAAVDDLKLNFYKYRDDFIAAQKDEASKQIILKSAVAMEDATKNLKFSYSIKVSSPVGKKAGLEDQATQLLNQLYQQIADAAYSAYDVTFFPKDENGIRYKRRFGQKAKAKFREIIAKLGNLSYFHPDITASSVRILNVVLDQTPTQLYIDDEIGNPCATRMFNLVKLMMDNETFLAVSEKYADSTTLLADIDRVLSLDTLTQNTGATDVVADTVDVEADVAQAVTILPVTAPVVVQDVLKPVKAYSPFAATF
jgi:hypothetical protein